MNPQDNKAARLETVILLLSFVGVWLYFLARQRALLAGGALPQWANLPLLALLAALVWVFVRRIRRVTRAMRENRIGIGQKPTLR